MTVKQLVFVATSMIASCTLPAYKYAAAAPERVRVVRLAELTIDPAQLEAYKSALKEEIETSVRVEPGVITLCAVSIKGHPEQVRIFEIYRDEASYRSHLQTPHFLKYKSMTQGMVKSLTLIETEPILLGSSQTEIDTTPK